MDAMNRDPNIPEPESAPTTKLLKKRPERIETETAVTAPLTSRLADLAIDEEDTKKSNVGLIVGGIIAGLAVIAVIVYFAFFSGGSSGIFSGGSADIAAGGTDSMDAQIVQGRSSGQAPADRPSAAAVASSPQPGADRRDDSARDTGRSGAAAPVVQAARIKSSASISSGSEAAPTIPVRPAPTQPAPAATPAQPRRSRGPAGSRRDAAARQHPGGDTDSGRGLLDGRGSPSRTSPRSRKATWSR